MKMESEQKKRGMQVLQRAVGVGSSAALLSSVLIPRAAAGWCHHSQGLVPSSFVRAGYRQCQPGRQGGAFVLWVHKAA